MHIKQRFGITPLLFYALFILLIPLSTTYANTDCGNGICDYKGGEDLFNCKPDCAIAYDREDSAESSVIIREIILAILWISLILCIFTATIGILYRNFPKKTKIRTETSDKLFRYSRKLFIIFIITILYLVLEFFSMDLPKII